MDAYRRSPTLLTGETDGRHGEVQVWSPDIRAIRRQLGALSMLVAVLVAIGIFLGCIFHCPLFVLNCISVPLIILFTVVAALRRPCYITTDDEGIGVTTAKSSRALRWEEIQSFEYGRLANYWQIKLNSGEKLQLNVFGYTQEKAKPLRALIEARADLCPQPTKMGAVVWRRRDALPPGNR